MRALKHLRVTPRVLRAHLTSPGGHRRAGESPGHSGPGRAPTAARLQQVRERVLATARRMQQGNATG